MLCQTNQSQVRIKGGVWMTFKCYIAIRKEWGKCAINIFPRNWKISYTFKQNFTCQNDSFLSAVNSTLIIADTGFLGKLISN